MVSDFSNNILNIAVTRDGGIHHTERRVSRLPLQSARGRRPNEASGQSDVARWKLTWLPFATYSLKQSLHFRRCERKAEVILTLQNHDGFVMDLPSCRENSWGAGGFQTWSDAEDSARSVQLES